MVFSTDWWLKRAFKFALKRYLGQLIRSEVHCLALDEIAILQCPSYSNLTVQIL